MLRTFAKYGDPDGVLHHMALELGIQYLLVASQYIQWNISGVLCRARGKSPLMHNRVNRATSR